MPARRFPVPAVLLASLFICSNAAAQQTLALQSPPSLPAVSTPTVPTLELDQTHEAATSTRHEHDEEAGDPDTDPDAHDDEHHTAFLGLGVRARVRETVSLVAEVSPRVWGYRPGRASWSVGIEKLTRGHVMQLNVGNNFGTTPGQVARGGSERDVYLGFNMSRKF